MKKAKAKAGPARARKKRSYHRIDEAAFVATFIATGSLMESAKAAGSTAKDLTVAGVAISKKPAVVAELKRAREAAAKKVDLTAEITLRQLKNIVTFDLRKLFNDDGSPKGIGELDDDTAAAIGGLDVLKQFEGGGKDREFVGYIKKYKITDKNQAIANAMKHLGLFERDNEQIGKGIAQIVRHPGKASGKR